MKKKEKKHTGTIIFSVITSTLLIIIVGFLCWPNTSTIKITQSNKKDKTKNQIEIIAKRINIRKEPKISSLDIGDVYAGEVYTVIEDVEDLDYYWYKIRTNTGITGFIASDKKDEYVKIVNGYIDRTPPVINYDKNYYALLGGKEDYSLITCTDEYSTCSLSIEKTNLYLEITAKDEKGNINKKSIRYYDVFKGGNYFNETNSNLSVYYTRKINDDGSMYITANYILNKTIPSAAKSIAYSTNINLYDENFNIIYSYDTKYNTGNLEADCINDNRLNLKEEYLNNDLNVGNKICANFYIPNSNSVKYFEISISGVDNYDNSQNYLNNYVSRIFIK